MHKQILREDRPPIFDMGKPGIDRELFAGMVVVVGLAMLAIGLYCGLAIGDRG